MRQSVVPHTTVTTSVRHPGELPQEEYWSTPWAPGLWDCAGYREPQCPGRGLENPLHPIKSDTHAKPTGVRASRPSQRVCTFFIEQLPVPLINLGEVFPVEPLPRREGQRAGGGMML